MIFNLWRHQTTGGLVIDSEAPFGYERVKTVEASEWLDAKRKFGFTLSPIQERLIQVPLEERLRRLQEQKEQGQA
jgi:hypothetical protein